MSSIPLANHLPLEEFLILGSVLLLLVLLLFWGLFPGSRSGKRK